MSWLTFGPLALVLHLAAFSTYITLQRRKPTATLAWILLVAVLPVIGLIIWLVFGGHRIHRQRRLRREAVDKVRPLWLRPGERAQLVGEDLGLSLPAISMIALGQAPVAGGPAWLPGRLPECVPG